MTKNTKKPHKLTVKQENFCLKYIETGNAHKAYITAYNIHVLDRQKEWTYSEASQLLNNPKITQRINEIREKISNENSINISSILFELEQARMTAHTKQDIQGMVRATVSKAKILGLSKLEKLNLKLDEQLEKMGENQ